MKLRAPAAVVATSADLSRLRWRCRRGMRELDVLLIGYVDREYAAALPEHQAAFEKLLTLQDPEILALLLDRVETDDMSLRYVVQRLLEHS